MMDTGATMQRNSQFIICKNPHEAANSILTHSFAIYRVDCDTHQSLVKAWKASRHFLCHVHTNSFTSRCTKDEGVLLPPAISSSLVAEAAREEKHYLKKYRNIYKGNLYGLNFPSSAKLLYRAFFSHNSYRNQRGKEEDDATCEDGKDNESLKVCQQQQQQQPWPDDFDGGELKHCSTDLSARLHDILVNCAEEIQHVVKQHETESIRPPSSPSSPSSLNQTRKRKMRHLSHDTTDDGATSHLFKATKRQYQPINLVHNSNDCASDKIKLKAKQVQSSSSAATEMTTTETSKTFTRSTLCPLDYFLYHNMNANAINCSEHIDRGVLICISMTNIQGLEIFSNTDQEWICPERLSQFEFLHSDNEAGCSSLICILSGDQLLNVLQEEENGVMDSNKLNAYKHSFPGLVPCIRRVKNKLSRARLSISYELRIP